MVPNGGAVGLERKEREKKREGRNESRGERVEWVSKCHVDV